MNERNSLALPALARRGTIIRGLGGLCGLAMLFAGGGVAAQSDMNDVVFEERSGELSDGTEYKLRLPDNWNGVVINDMDFAQKADEQLYMTLLRDGYAFAGTSRRKDRRPA